MDKNNEGPSVEVELGEGNAICRQVHTPGGVDATVQDLMRATAGRATLMFA